MSKDERIESTYQNKTNKELHALVNKKEAIANKTSQQIGWLINVAVFAVVFFGMFAATLCYKTIFGAGNLKFIYEPKELIGICAIFAAFTSLLMVVTTFLMQTKQAVVNSVSNFQQFIDFFIERRRSELRDGVELMQSMLIFNERYWHSAWRDTPMFGTGTVFSQEALTEHLVGLIERPFNKIQSKDHTAELLSTVIENLPSSHRTAISSLKEIFKIAKEQDDGLELGKNRVQQFVFTSLSPGEKLLGILGLIVENKDFAAGLLDTNERYFKDIESNVMLAILDKIRLGKHGDTV